MSMFTVLLVLPIPLFLFVITLLVVLQVRLCKKSTKLGLILPAISFVFSLLMTISVQYGWGGPRQYHSYCDYFLGSQHSHNHFRLYLAAL